MRYIALLRGVNVGGHQVKMERLRALFAELGYSNVRSYIQTGNVFFDTDADDREELTQAIELQLITALGFAVPVFLRTIPELEQALALDPFKAMPVSDDMRLSIVFAANPIPDSLALPAWSARRDMQITQTTTLDAFVVWYLKDGRPPADQAFLEQALGSKVTSRFLHTAAKILAAAQGK